VSAAHETTVEIGNQDVALFYYAETGLRAMNRGGSIVAGRNGQAAEHDREGDIAKSLRRTATERQLQRWQTELREGGETTANGCRLPSECRRSR
jgi:hypothetical protein